VAWDHVVPESSPVGDGEQRPRLRCRQRPLGHDVPEQHAARLGLNGVRMDCHEVIAEDALLVRRLRARLVAW
jgi:hypothetical protein